MRLPTGCFQLKWIKAGLSCLDHQQAGCTVSPSSQRPLIVFPLRTDGLFVLSAPSNIPAVGQWMLGGSSGWDDCLCVCVWGQNGSCLLWVGVFMRGGEWFLSPCCLISVQFFPCLLHAHYQSSFCCEMRSRLCTRTDGSAVPYRKLPLLWRDSPGIYVVDWLIEYDFQFRLVAMMMVPRNTFFWLFGVWVFAFSFHRSWLECAGMFMWSPSCDKISRHLGFQWCHSLILRR